MTARIPTNETPKGDAVASTIEGMDLEGGALIYRRLSDVYTYIDDLIASLPREIDDFQFDRSAPHYKAWEDNATSWINDRLKTAQSDLREVANTLRSEADQLCQALGRSLDWPSAL